MERREREGGRHANACEDASDIFMFWFSHLWLLYTHFSRKKKKLYHTNKAGYLNLSFHFRFFSRSCSVPKIPQNEKATVAT